MFLKFAFVPILISMARQRVFNRSLMTEAKGMDGTPMVK